MVFSKRLVRNQKQRTLNTIQLKNLDPKIPTHSKNIVAKLRKVKKPSLFVIAVDCMKTETPYMTPLWCVTST